MPPSEIQESRLLGTNGFSRVLKSKARVRVTIRLDAAKLKFQRVNEQLIPTRNAGALPEVLEYGYLAHIPVVEGNATQWTWALASGGGTLRLVDGTYVDYWGWPKASRTMP
jgi:hypothetical protein